MRGRIEQAWANRLKVLRAAIRLKYSLMADNEINALVDTERKKFMKSVQEGVLLPAIEPERALSTAEDA